MGYVWQRQAYNGAQWLGQQQWYTLATLAAGQTITRVRFAWGFAGTTSASVVASKIAVNGMAWGLVTAIGPSSSTVPPSPQGGEDDVAPPTQRWLWWEWRVPVASTWDSAGNVVTWTSSTPQEAADTRAQVLAPSMASGSTLNLYATFEPVSAWDSSGAANLWMYANVLIKQP